MKKIFLTILLSVMALTTVFAMGKTEEGNSLEKIQKKGVFVLGLDDSFPPLGFRDKKDNIVGYDIDIATEVCKRLGVKLECQPIDWNAKEQEIATGMVDCLWNGFTITPEREEVLCFSEPYLNNAQVVIVRKGEGFDSLESLAGKKIGLQAGSSAAVALDDHPEFKKSVSEVVEFKENLTALMDLETKGIDAVIMDVVVGSYNIKTSGRAFEILPENLSLENYGIGFRKDDVELRDAVNAILEEMAADGTMSKIDHKWFDKDISVVGKNQ